MKSFILISLVIFLGSSCSNYQDYFEVINQKPELLLNGTTEFYDTLKIGYSQTYALKVADEETLIPVINQSCSDSICYNWEGLEITARGEGNNEISLVVTDSYLKKAEVKLHLHTFKNLSPVAKLSVSGNDNILLDASNSYDRDLKFAGHIVRYYFTINNYVVDVDKPSINYVFESTGIKLIKLKVQDNEGLWSEEISINHTVN